ncbi:MAG: hypothetical protein KBB70_00665 [Candidatus Pacebacteria bacterium]|jgi:hypothetical protein|nr:hypothetical protein [Candidatus Paceibacterota bacterium]
MQKITTLVLAIFMVMNGCSSKKRANTATIDFTEPVNENATYIFSTCGGKMIIFADASAAQKINSLLHEHEGATINNLGVGNAFIVDSNGTFLLYTARHCTVGIEKITHTLNADIAVVDYKGLRNISPSVMEITEGYKIQPNVSSGDSVYVRGYYTDNKGHMYSVCISGVGELSDRRDTKKRVIGAVEYFSERVFNVLLEENIDLGGLSGAPAFDKFGNVIGIYCGRTIDQSTGDCFARITLF